MKKLISLFTSIALLLSSHTFANANFKSYDLNAAMKEAQAKNKLILVYFYTDRCTAYRRLEKDVFQDAAISQFINETFVCIKVNGLTEYGLTLTNRYNLKRLYPNTLLLDAKGMELECNIGFGGKQVYYNKLHNYSKNRDTLNDLLARLKADPDDCSLMLSIAKKYFDHRLLEEASYYFERAFGYQPCSGNAYDRYALCGIYQKLNKTQNAIKALKEAIQIMPNNGHFLSLLKTLESK